MRLSQSGIYMYKVWSHVWDCIRLWGYHNCMTGIHMYNVWSHVWGYHNCMIGIHIIRYGHMYEVITCIRLSQLGDW